MAAELRISIIAVTFDIAYDPGNSGLLEDEAMLQLLAFTPGVQLKSGNHRYQSGNYEQMEGGIWRGRIDLLRTAQSSSIVHDASQGYRFQDDDARVTSTEASTQYAYDPEGSILVMRERAFMPPTRMRSYLKKATALYGLCTERPRREHFAGQLTDLPDGWSDDL